MNSTSPLGLYLLKKESTEQTVLKDLLQFLRTNAPGKGNSFSYIEANTSLHPHLSLWENLQLEVGATSWKEFQLGLNSDTLPLVKLIRDPMLLTSKAECWEKFLVSLIKGLMSPSQSLLIDMNEDLLSPFMIQQFKKCILEATKGKSVYLASGHSSLWIDCAHTLVGRKEYRFEIESLDVEILKLKWAL